MRNWGLGPHLFGIYLVKISKISFEEAQTYAEENGLIFLETSAKNAENVDEIFFEIARKLPKLEVNHSNAQCTHNWKNSSWRGRQTKWQKGKMLQYLK